jgi:hypothetical protein
VKPYELHPVPLFLGAWGWPTWRRDTKVHAVMSRLASSTKGLVWLAPAPGNEDAHALALCLRHGDRSVGSPGKSWWSYSYSAA